MVSEGSDMTNSPYGSESKGIVTSQSVKPINKCKNK
jgi:hypothetical protein